MKRPKVLIALFRLPYPATDGTRYKILNNVIEGLAKDFDLEFFITTIDRYSSRDIQYLEQTYGKVYVFSQSRFMFALRAAVSLFKNIPAQSNAFIISKAKRWIKVHYHEYDGFYIHEIRMTEYFRRLPHSAKGRMLVDFNDAISRHYLESVKHRSSLILKIMFWFEGIRVRRYERKILELFQHFNIVTIQDRQALINSARGEVDSTIDFLSIPHGVALPPISRLEKASHILFLGNTSYDPNADALNYLFQYLWNDIALHYPPVQFCIAGKGKPVPTTPDDSRIRYLGFVPDLTEIFDETVALVAPIRNGGGVPSKILECMGRGIPVITTPIGAAGIIGAADGENIFIIPETDREAWVRIIERLYTDFDLRKKIGTAARALVEQQYSSASSQQQFRDFFHRIVS
jgi:glycosyltransferase involved in cell wall biosynthesis